MGPTVTASHRFRTILLPFSSVTVPVSGCNTNMEGSEGDSKRSGSMDNRINEWNSTDMDFPRDASAHSIVLEQCDKTPELPAVRFEDKELSYYDLKGRIHCVSEALLSLGVQEGECVGICVKRTENMPVAVLGVLNAGAVYVPMDPLFAQSQLVYMIDDAEVRFIVTDEMLKGFVDDLAQADLEESNKKARVGYSGKGEKEPRIKSIVMNDELFEGVVSHLSKENPTRTGFNSEQLTYVMYTSGSTGKPKGVQLCHRNIVNFLYTMAQTPGLKEGDVLLAVTTLTFDIALLEFMLPIAVGGVTHIASREVATDGTALKQLLEDSKANVMQATPATWRVLVESGWTGEKRLEKILCGGEAFPPKLATQLLSRGDEVWNMYGPTETCIWSSVMQVLEPPKGNTVPIGRGIGNTQFYVLDGERQPVGVDEVGDIYIGGDGVSKGYLNLPVLTRNAFFRDPFSERGDARMFKCGDLGKWMPDGNVECLGRNDFQVKVRGYRIELEAIETVLENHEAVRQCVVSAVAEENDPDNKRLVAYVILDDSQSPPEHIVLQEFVLSKLPTHMVPTMFVQMDKFPLNSNGKVNRKELPKPDASHTVRRESATLGPQTVVQRLLAERIKELLKLPSVGIQDNIFSLGADSLAAQRLHNFIDSVFRKTVSPLAIFENNTIEKLEEIIGSVSIDVATVRQYLGESSAKEYAATLPEAGSKGRFSTRASKGVVIDGLSAMNGNGTPNGNGDNKIGISKDGSSSTSENRNRILTIVPIQPLGERPPFFMVHPAGGFIYPYLSMVANIGKDQPFYGVQNPSLSGVDAHHFNSIEDMAAHYIEELRKVQPHGPYHLGGWSLGGTIAMEMGQQLIAVEEKVNVVVVVDSIYAEKYDRMSFWGQNFKGSMTFITEQIAYRKKKHERNAQLAREGKNRQKFARHCMMTGMFGAAQLLMPAKHKKAITQGENFEFESMGGLDDQDGVAKDPEVQRMLKMVDQHMKLVDVYEPKFFPGRMIAIRCAAQPPPRNGSPDPYFQWIENCKEGGMRTISGDHYSLFRQPHVKSLVQMIREAVDGVLNDESSWMDDPFLPDKKVAEQPGTSGTTANGDITGGASE